MSLATTRVRLTELQSVQLHIHLQHEAQTDERGCQSDGRSCDGARLSIRESPYEIYPRVEGGNSGIEPFFPLIVRACCGPALPARTCSLATCYSLRYSTYTPGVPCSIFASLDL